MRNVIHALWSDGSNELAADFIPSGFFMLERPHQGSERIGSQFSPTLAMNK